MSRIVLISTLAFALQLHGCAVGVGAGAAGAAYDYQNKEKLEQLEADLEAGRISREEYLRRKEQIEEGSAVY